LKKKLKRIYLEYKKDTDRTKIKKEELTLE